MSSERRTEESAATANERDTRVCILEAAWALIRSRGVATVSMAEIADSAGVSRQALYLHFNNRTRLLLEMAQYHDEAARISERITQAIGSSSSVEALGIYVRTWCAYLPEILPVAGVLAAAAPGDEAARAVWRERMRFLRDRGGVRVIERLAADGRLAEGWSVAEATDWLWSQLHPDNWRHLVGEADWKPRRYVDRLVNTLERVLLGDRTRRVRRLKPSGR
jgi:AcrR family transcriptional regulator